MITTTNQKEQLRKFYDAFNIEPSGHIELKEDQKENEIWCLYFSYKNFIFKFFIVYYKFFKMDYYGKKTE